MRIPLTLITAVALASGLSACSNEDDPFAMSIGDCASSTSLKGDEVASLPTVDCETEHDVEGYAAMQLPDGDYPGQDAVQSAANDFCLTEFEGYVGTPYEDSALSYSFLYPTERSWNDHEDREVLCLIVSEDPVTGSVKGSGQ